MTAGARIPLSPRSDAWPASTSAGWMRMFGYAMSEDKPTPLEDVRKGLGLLFRAARAAVGKLETRVEKLETRGVEDVVVTSAREVGRAIENVASAIEREVFGKKGERDGHSKSDRPNGEPDEPPDRQSPPNDSKPPT
jgi:hypothetical protein